MFISTKSLSESLENNILRVIDNELKGNLRFVGRCFGRFDMVAEFDEESAKVASYKVCKIQEKAAKELRKIKDVSKDPICSSLMLCNEVFDEDILSHEDTDSKYPALRLYSFLYPRKPKIDLVKILTQLIDTRKSLKSINGSASLFFSLSNYSFLLMISGNKFCKMFDEFMKFRAMTKDVFLESCTYVAIGIDKNGEMLKDLKCDNKKIKAYIFLKLKDGFGDINIQEGGIIKSIDKRFGWSDISLEVEAYTLYEIKRKILDLREKYRDQISNTSTLILPEKGGVIK